MASSCSHLMRQVCKTRRLFNNSWKEAWHRRYFGFCPAVCQESASAPAVSGTDGEIVIPRKKTWSKEAVLQALAATVNRDPTALHYLFQDDSFLTPKTAVEYKLYSMSQESGRNAAKYFINTYPKYFQKDFAEPHIPCLMPETVELQIQEVSEEALVERIRLRKVTAAVDMYDRLVQAGTPLSLDLTNDLLDLICLYGDRDPPREDVSEQRTEDVAEKRDDLKQINGRPQRASELLKIVWKENNNAQRIFNTMPEWNSRSYGALIRGMVKYGAYSKAFDVYTDLLNNRLTADVHTFNALISAAGEVREKFADRWELIVDLLKQMAQQKVKPNLLTFNALLKVLRWCGSLARTQAFPILNEMKALGIDPSLATYGHILAIFYKAAISAQGHTEILQQVLNEISGKSFTAQDPDDVQFFTIAMRVCLDKKDLELAYRLHSLLEVGDNWQLLGDSYYQNLYFARFFNLLCMMEHVDVVLKWYRDFIPSVFYPSSQGIKHLLQALDTDNRLDLIPQIWKDIKQMGHSYNVVLLEQILSLMAREKLSAEVQQTFADCALDVKGQYMQTDQGRQRLRWSTNSLSSVTSILLAAKRIKEAGEMLTIFKATNIIPSEELMNEFFACVKALNDAQQAVNLVQISARFCLPITPHLTERVQQEFQLTDEQKRLLSDLESSTDE